MLILKAKSGALWAARAVGEGIELHHISGPSGLHESGTAIISTASWTVGEIFTEVFEPEGEVGALTRAVLAYRDAFLRDVGLNDDDAPVESYEPFRRMVALAEAIAPSSPPQG